MIRTFEGNREPMSCFASTEIIISRQEKWTGSSHTEYIKNSLILANLKTYNANVFIYVWTKIGSLKNHWPNYIELCKKYSFLSENKITNWRLKTHVFALLKWPNLTKNQFQTIYLLLKRLIIVLLTSDKIGKIIFGLNHVRT